MGPKKRKQKKGKSAAFILKEEGSNESIIKSIKFSSFKLYFPDELPIDKELIVQVELASQVIETSPPVSTFREEECEEVKHNSEININDWKFIYDVDSESFDEMDLLMSNPLIFTVTMQDNKQSQLNEKNNIHLGTCCLDLLSILMTHSKKTKNESLILHGNEFEYGEELPRWPKLPKLMLSIDVIYGPLIEFYLLETSNIVYFTLESIYHPPLEMRNTPNLKYRAATDIPLKNEELQRLYFDNGKLALCEDMECKKKWIGVGATARYAYSSYKLFTQNASHRLGIDVEILQGKSVPRIEWNSLSRHILYSHAVNEFRFLLDRRKCWPLELLFSPETSITTKGQQKTKNSVLKNENNNYHYICFLNLKGLLQPGETKTRVATQLFTYCQEDVLQECIMEQSLFKNEDDDLTEFETIPSKTSKSKKDTRRKKSSSPKGIQQEENVNNDLYSPLGVSEYLTRPVFDEMRNPCFVIVEIELTKPLNPALSMKGILDMLLIKLPKIEDVPTKVECAELARKNFKSAITAAAHQINNEYSNYIEFSKEQIDICEPVGKLCEEKKPCADYLQGKQSNKNNKTKNSDDERIDNVERFLEHSKKTGTYTLIKSTLGSAIRTLVKDAFIFDSRSKEDPDPIHKTHNHINQNYISDIYSRLVDDMHGVINTLVTDQETELTIEIEGKEYFRFIYEAEHFQDLKSAERFQLQRVERNKMNPYVWIELASFWLRIGVEDSRPEECIKEALSLNNRNAKGLIMYGLLLTQRGEYKEAKLMLEAATMFNPKMSEVWFALHLFAEHIDDLPTSDWALIMARRNFDTIEREYWPSSGGQPLEWSSTYYQAHNLYYSCFICLMELSLFEFAESTAAKYLSHFGKSSLIYNYMMSIIHLNKKRYKASLYHIQQALPGRTLDPPLHLIAGLCYYALGELDLMKIQFEYLDQLEWNREIDVRIQENIRHLVHIHLGWLYMSEKEYMKARLQFRTGARRTPSPRIFFALGRANYKLGLFLKSEKALIRANYLDNYNPETWGYLAIMNILKSCRPAFEQCYRQMIKNGLKNEELLEEIEILKKWCKFSDPEIIGPQIPCICQSSEKNENIKTKKETDEEIQEIHNKIILNKE